MRFSARILGLLLAFFLTIFVSKVSFAQTNYSPSQNTQLQKDLIPNTDSNVPGNMHYFTQGLLLEIMSAVTCQIVGIDPIDPTQQCLNVNPATGKLGFTGSGGAIGAVTTMISGLYTVPIQFGDYVAYLSNNFGVVKQTYAQNFGSGFYSLAPMLKLWTALRNISYLLFVVIFLVVGFAIMLRVNIDARTVMTIQNQIPKLIIGILLVTFSYAIAGLLVDTMWVANYVLINSFSPYTGQDAGTTLTQATGNAPAFVNYVFGDQNSPIVNWGGIIGVTAGASNGIGDMIQRMFEPHPEIKDSFQQSPPSPGGGGGCALGPLCLVGDLINGVGAMIGNIISSIIGTFVSWIVRIMAFLIIGIAILFALIKLWIALIKAYVFVLIDVILAPFWIVAGLLPGAGAGVGFGAWVKDLLGNLMAFPATIGLFLLGKVILNSFQTNGSTNGVTAFNPPLISSTLQGSGIGSLLALGIILMSPGIVNATKKAFKSTGGLSFNGGEFTKAGSGIVGGFIGGTAGNFFRRDQYGRPIGAGATFMSKHINNPVSKHLLGWRESHYVAPAEIQAEARAATSRRPVIIQHVAAPAGGETNTPPATTSPAKPPIVIGHGQADVASAVKDRKDRS